jgi:hypothetical protein
MHDLPFSSFTLYKPLGTMTLPFEIRTIIAFSKCFSDPGKAGKECIYSSKLPLRI